MLIKFRVENHRSLRDEQELSMVASDADDGRLIKLDWLPEGLLPAIAIYGANASGKTNALGALAFMRAAVNGSHRLWEPDSGTPQEPFALSERANAPSLYEVEIVVDRVRYQYGFVVSATRVEEEWLHAWPLGRKQVWFDREGDVFEFGKNFHGENETIRGLTRPNSLFLSAGAQNNHAALLPVFRWFHPVHFEMKRNRAGFAFHGNIGTLLGELFAPQHQQHLFDEASAQKDRDFIVRLLQAADTGILDIRVEEGSPTPEVERLAARRGRVSRRFEVSFRHKTGDEARAWLPLDEESAGTITLVDLATRLVRILANGGLLCVDELESSLHPMIALELLRLFHDRTQNPHGAQLIFTTHDTNLLGNVLGAPPLRRDQVWFAEKDTEGATHIYPLTDFSPRKEENLERGYLQGRYGAIPFLGSLASSRPESDQSRPESDQS
jgi:hypothetical protein